MIISLDSEKLFKKFKVLHDKGLRVIRDTRNVSKHNKAIYSKSTASIKQNGQKLKVIPLKLERR